MKELLLAALVWFTLGVASTASAEDYVITVPVRVENLRHVSSMTVYCAAIATDRMSSGAGGQAMVPLVDGAFNGELTVRVTLGIGERREDFARYECWLQFYFPDPTGPQPNEMVTDDPIRLEYYTRQTGQSFASLQMRQSGPLH